MIIDPDNNSVIKIAKYHNKGIYSRCKNNAYTPERLDTNYLPRAADAEPNSWTQTIL